LDVEDDFALVRPDLNAIVISPGGDLEFRLANVGQAEAGDGKEEHDTGDSSFVHVNSFSGRGH
jgi:hypothetical protein